VSLLHQLTAKPWVTAQARIDDLHIGGTFSLSKAKLGLQVFLTVVTVLFMLLILAYGSRMALEDWRPQPQLGLLWLNTAMLVCGSIAMQWALIAARRGQTDGVWTGLIAGGAFTLAFLGGQLVAWRQLNMLAGFDITNPAIGFFFLITALHGLHLFGGLVAWARVTAKFRHGHDVDQIRASVELCTIYWHYLLLVWLVLFGLLFSGSDNLDILLTICGLK
jgi:cytochrome c oxidase subunit III